MAHQTEIVVNGQTVEVTEFDHTAQEIDDMCDAAQPILPDGTGLPISQGGTGATTPQAALANLGAGVRPNIARNPAFVVNQRNFTSDNWTSGYGPDGWDSVGIGYLTFNGSTICCYGQYICQRYEAGVIKKGKYTVSALCDGQIYVLMGYWGSEITVDAISTNYQNGIASVTLDIPSDNDEVMGYIYIRTVTSGGEITYVKIEQGSTQTLAYQDSTGAWQLLPQPESDYATQLAKCQRYLVVIGGNDYFAVGNGIMRTATEASIVCPLPVPLRVRPVVQLSGVLSVRLSDMENDSATGILVDASGIGAVLFKITCANPHTAGSAADSFLAPEGKLFISAEL